MARAVGAVIEIQGAGTERTRTDGIIRQPAELHVLQRGRGVDRPFRSWSPARSRLPAWSVDGSPGVNVGEGGGGS